MLINNSIPETHRANQILWLGMMVGATLITLILAQMNFENPEFLNFNNFITSIFALIGAVLCLLSLLLPDFLVRNRLEQANLDGLSEKFDDFRANTVFKIALHEGPALICAIFMHLENNIYFIFFVAFNLLMLYTARPTIEKFKKWYKLTTQESQGLESLEFLPLISKN